MGIDATARIIDLLTELHTLGARVDVILPDGTHLYWCTGHRHGITDHCGSTKRLDGEPKEPARCKWCPASCRGPAYGSGGMPALMPGAPSPDGAPTSDSTNEAGRRRTPTR